MATINAGYARCYSSSSTSYGYYKVDVEYSGSSRNGRTVTVTGVKIIATRQGTGYATNPISCSASCGNQSFSGVTVSSSGSASPASWSRDLGTCTFDVDAGTSSVGCYVWFGATNTGIPVDTTVSIPCPTAGSPSYNSITVSNIARTTATITTSANAGSNASLSTVGHDVGTSTSNYSFYNSNPTNLTGLAANTKYYYRGYIVNNAGLGTNSSWGNFTTTGNEPSISSKSISAGRTTATLTYSASYDTNASFSSLSLRYGTTTSYGSTISGTSITGLQPNTTYYYSLTVTDNWGRTSSASTGSFTTTGNNPVINSTTSVPSRNGCTINFNASYDTNSSLNSILINYGTTTSYGSTSSSTGLSGLSPNTTYYYNIKITDNWGRTSNTMTGSFLTSSNGPVFTLEEVTSYEVQTAILDFLATPDSGVTISGYELYDALSGDIAISLQSSGTFEIDGLTGGTYYEYYCVVYDSAGHTATSNNVDFTTNPGVFVHTIDNNGNNVTHSIYAIGDPKNIIKHLSWEQGDIAFLLGRSYTNACALGDVSTTEVRTNLYGIYKTTLNDYDAITISKTEVNWKIQCYDANGNGLKQVAGLAGQSGYINFTDKNGFIAIVLQTTETDIDKLKDLALITPCLTEDIEDATSGVYKIKKEITKTDVVKVSKFMRYIDIGQSGSTINKYNHIVEVDVYDKDGNNVSLNKLPIVKLGKNGTNLEYITDGNVSSSQYASITGTNTIVQIDLGQVYEIDHINIWRYFTDNRRYYKTFLYGRNNDKELCYKFHDYKRDGTYEETADGKTFNVYKQPEDTDKPVITSFTQDTVNWTNQGVLLTITATDSNYDVSELLYSFDNGLTWGNKSYRRVYFNQTYIALVKDPSGNISDSNPSITINNIDLVAPTHAYVKCRYDTINGDYYNGEWTKENIYLGMMKQNSSNKCPNDFEVGSIDLDIGLDEPGYDSIRSVSKTIINDTGTLYVGRYDIDISNDSYVLWYDSNNNYLSNNKLSNIQDNFLSIPNNASYIRITEKITETNRKYMICVSDVAVDYDDYYIVYDNLSGINGWFYTFEDGGRNYQQMLDEQVFNVSTNKSYFIYVKDNAGNYSKPIEVPIKIDKNAPLNITLSVSISGTSANLACSAVDNESGIAKYEFSKDGGNTWDLSNNNEYSYNDLIDGNIYDFQVKVTDNVDNYDTSAIIAKLIGTNSNIPIINNISNNPTEWQNYSAILEVNATSPINNTITSYSIDGGKNWQESNQFAISNNGTYYFRVKDNNNLTSETFILLVDKIDTIPPTIVAPSRDIEIYYGRNGDVTTGLIYSDNESGINENSLVISPEISSLPIGDNTITYYIEDNAGNSSTTTKQITITGSIPSSGLYPGSDVYPGLY